MMTRRSRRRRMPRGTRPEGLFWQPGRPDGEPELDDNPLVRACPFPPCHARAGEPCTARGGRKRLVGYHDARHKPEERQ